MGELIMRNAMLALISVSVLLFASSAWAGNYVTGKLGLYLPEEGVLDNGGNFEAAYGFDLSRATSIDYLALEVGLGYYTASGDEHIGAGWLGYYNYDWDVDVLPVTVTGIYTYHFKQTPFSVYGGAGLGLYYVMWDAGPADGDDLEFGAHVVGGGRFAFNGAWEVFAELKFNAVSGDYDWDGKFVNFGLKYNF